MSDLFYNKNLFYFIGVSPWLCRRYRVEYSVLESQERTTKMLYDLLDNLELYLDEYKVPAVIITVMTIVTIIYNVTH